VLEWVLYFHALFFVRPCLTFSLFSVTRYLPHAPSLPPSMHQVHSGDIDNAIDRLNDLNPEVIRKGGEEGLGGWAGWGRAEDARGDKGGTEKERGLKAKGQKGVDEETLNLKPSTDVQYPNPWDICARINIKP
jgi:hypothetical protein